MAGFVLSGLPWRRSGGGPPPPSAASPAFAVGSSSSSFNTNGFAARSRGITFPDNGHCLLRRWSRSSGSRERRRRMTMVGLDVNAKDDSQKRRKRNAQKRNALFAIVSFLAFTVAGMFFLSAMISNKEWSQSLDALTTRFGQRRAAVVLFLLTFVATLFPLGSTSNFATASGFLLGTFGGFALAFAAKYSASMLIFLLGGTTLRPFIRQQLKNYPNAAKMLEAVETKGWPIMVALRISPVPTVFVNYLYAVAKVDSFVYVVASAVGMVPLVFRAVLFGSAARSITSSAGGASSWELTLSILLVIGLTLLAGKVGQHVRNLSQKQEEDSPADPPPTPQV